MSREDRRALKKKLNNKKVRDKLANTIYDMGVSVSHIIRDNSFVKLDVDKIVHRKDYMGVQEEYRNFVESNRNTVFLAHAYRPKPDGFSNLFELEGVEKWLFWYGDLIQLDDALEEA